MTTREHLDMGDPLRAGDDERDRVVRELTRHCGDGRLTLEELEQRIQEAYAATTRDELRDALRELPSHAPARQSGPPIRVRTETANAAARRAGEVALKVHALVYLAVIGLLVMIWALTSFGGHFWPIWTAMPWGVALGVHAGVHRIANS